MKRCQLELHFLHWDAWNDIVLGDSRHNQSLIFSFKNPFDWRYKTIFYYFLYFEINCFVLASIIQNISAFFYLFIYTKAF